MRIVERRWEDRAPGWLRRLIEAETPLEKRKPAIGGQGGTGNHRGGDPTKQIIAQHRCEIQGHTMHGHIALVRRGLTLKLHPPHNRVLLLWLLEATRQGIPCAGESTRNRAHLVEQRRHLLTSLGITLQPIGY